MRALIAILPLGCATFECGCGRARSWPVSSGFPPRSRSPRHVRTTSTSPLLPTRATTARARASALSVPAIRRRSALDARFPRARPAASGSAGSSCSALAESGDRARIPRQNRLVPTLRPTKARPARDAGRPRRSACTAVRTVRSRTRASRRRSRPARTGPGSSATLSHAEMGADQMFRVTPRPVTTKRVPFEPWPTPPASSTTSSPRTS